MRHWQIEFPLLFVAHWQPETPVVAEVVVEVGVVVDQMVQWESQELVRH